MRKAGIVLGAGLIAALLVEILLRWMQAPALDYYRKVKLLHVYHPEYFVALPENEDLYIRHHDGLWEGRFTTNSLGMRGSPEPIPGRSKILCLGDSLVMGFGVSDHETFCNLLNQYSESGQFQKNYQFMNIGVDAFGSMGSALRMEDMVPRLDNVEAVMFVISPNDFEVPEELARQGVEPDDVKDARRMNDPAYKLSFRIQFELTRYSYALQAAKLAYENLLIKRSITTESIKAELIEAGFMSPEPPPGNNNGSDSSAQAQGDQDQAGRESPLVDLSRTLNYTVSSFRGPVRDRCNYMNPESETVNQCPEPIPTGVSCLPEAPPVSELPPLPEFTQKAYDRMIEYAKKNNVKLIPVIIPIQVEEIYCANRGMYHPLGNYAIRSSDYFEKRGVSVMQLLPEASSMCSRDHLIVDHFIPADGHFTKIGNKWAADAIKKHLPEELEPNR
ncbi:MAG TPA: lipase [Leptospiraceae bacterium]|nr:lipase [Spirochaetaceae bacterium]HBS04790.1 lipase [Leptospiraceae bacterium]|tara:strand:- start:10030 stop:11367 length:1338 start_codon:yes stop_codon:yes gene_type:complete